MPLVRNTSAEDLAKAIGKLSICEQCFESGTSFATGMKITFNCEIHTTKEAN